MTAVIGQCFEKGSAIAFVQYTWYVALFFNSSSRNFNLNNILYIKIVLLFFKFWQLDYTHVFLLGETDTFCFFSFLFVCFFCRKTDYSCVTRM